MPFSKWVACGIIMSAVSAHAEPELKDPAVTAEPAIVAAEATSATEPTPLVLTTLPVPLPAGTPVIVSLDAELSTQTSLLGDSFAVTVVHDVLQDGVIIIPKGTRGRGEVTFVTKKGAFGKPGIIGIALRDMELNGRQVLLDGRFREEGGNNNGAAAATMFAVGIVAGLVKGKTGVIPAGRELKGRTGEDIAEIYSAPAVEAKDAPTIEPVPTDPMAASEPQTESTGGKI